MKELRGKVAAVTGTFSGIGRMLAVVLVKQGCAVAISDTNARGLEETAAMLASGGVRVTEHLVDVAARDQVYRYADDVVQQHGRAAGGWVAGEILCELVFQVQV